MVTVRPSRRRYFNPRTPVGCDLASGPSIEVGWNFNPRTPVGCDVHRHRQRLDTGISIHAPQWGATDLAFPIAHDARISIHAPQWGATVHHAQARVTHVISIHAPQWGATISQGGMVSDVSFQSTHPSGVRLPMVSDPSPLRLFQSTHPSGVRRPGRQQIPKVLQFQSTHPSGVRLETSIVSWPAYQFQSTHPSGVRRGRHDRRPARRHISIHAPQWGATPAL